MGTVWAARHELLGRDFALKFAVLPARQGPEARERFLREAQTVGKLRHPNVVDVADFGEAAPGAGLYLAMELLEGQSLAERIEAHGPLTPPEAVAVAVEIARGLSAAHAAGIVHHDIKPENIFLARGPEGGIVPKLLDFGISKQQAEDPAASTNGQPIGTPAYMSPEQALGELDIDKRTDIWSLGVVLYEVLSGKHPFVAPNYQALMTRIAEEPFAPLDAVPTAVRAIVERCLEKNPGARFEDADALGRALEDALSELSQVAEGGIVIERLRALPSLRPSRPTQTPVMEEPKRASRYVLVIGAALAILAIVSFIVWVRAKPAGVTSTSSVEPASATHEPSEVADPSSPVATTATPNATQNPPTTTPSLAPSAASPQASASSSSRRPPSTIGKRPPTSVNDPGF
jgi:eukaryotic-like serine/threonine-protein kinase